MNHVYWLLTENQIRILAGIRRAMSEPEQVELACALAGPSRWDEVRETAAELRARTRLFIQEEHDR